MSGIPRTKILKAKICSQSKVKLHFMFNKYLHFTLINSNLSFREALLYEASVILMDWWINPIELELLLHETFP